mmetsp:Transcript_15237/g.34041  ORF Transcript_15237/g.34041 Transcript_15237/m.34041 type:complete len:249 (+) Transcript_15237:556-1302(+)
MVINRRQIQDTAAPAAANLAGRRLLRDLETNMADPVATKATAMAAAGERYIECFGRLVTSNGPDSGERRRHSYGTYSTLTLAMRILILLWHVWRLDGRVGGRKWKVGAVQPGRHSELGPSSVRRVSTCGRLGRSMSSLAGRTIELESCLIERWRLMDATPTSVTPLVLWSSVRVILKGRKNCGNVPWMRVGGQLPPLFVRWESCILVRVDTRMPGYCMTSMLTGSSPKERRQRFISPHRGWRRDTLVI